MKITTNQMASLKQHITVALGALRVAKEMPSLAPARINEANAALSDAYDVLCEVDKPAKR